MSPSWAAAVGDESGGDGSGGDDDARAGAGTAAVHDR